MHVREVVTARDRRQFVEMAAAVNAASPQWVRPLDRDVEDVFRPDRNPAHERGDCARWLAYDSTGCVGRIAAFTDAQNAQAQPTGGVGFFECVDDEAVAALLFDTARSWLGARGMQAMDGPVNFGDRDRWWGLLVQGFDQPPLYLMNHNPAYYQQLFRRYGFAPYFRQLCYSVDVDATLPAVFARLHDRLSGNRDYAVRHIDKRRLAAFAKDFAHVYNLAWAAHGEGKQVTAASIEKLLRTMKPMMDVDLVWCAYHRDDPVALFAGLPNLNEILPSTGRLGPLEMAQVLYRRHRGTCTSAVGLVFGVVPDYQRRGVAAYLIVEALKAIRARTPYRTYELEWIGEFNPRMIAVAEGLNGRPTRTLVTYRYLFDRAAPPQRHPMVS